MEIVEIQSAVNGDNQAVLRITLDLPIVVDNNIIDGTQVAAMKFGNEFIEKLSAKLEELYEEPSNI